MKTPFISALPPRRSLSIRHLLLLITASLTLMIVLLAARDVFANVERLRSMHELRSASATSDLIFDATDNISVERDLALSVLQASEAETTLSLQRSLGESRLLTDKSVATALSALDRLSLQDMATIRRSFRARYDGIRSLRLEVDRALTLPLSQRDPVLIERWRLAATELMSDVESIWVGFVRPFTGIDAVATQHLRYSHALRTITDYMGRERSVIGQILSENTDPRPEQTASLLRGEGVLDLSWRNSRIFAEQSGLYPEIASYYTDVESHFATLHDMTRGIFYVPGVRHRSYPIGAELWFELSSQAAESLAALRGASRVAIGRYLDRLIGTIEREIAIQAVISLVALMLCVACFWLIAARVINPINRIVTALTRAMRGEPADFAMTVRAGDEIGKLGQVLEAFRSNMETIDASARALEAEVGVRRVAEEVAQAQLQRLALLHQISRAIGERQDLSSIFHVVIEAVEDQLPADFVCICMHDSAENALGVAGVGPKSNAFAATMLMDEGARISVDENDLAGCMGGRLIYEPDVTAPDSPLAHRLALSGLRSLVAAPLQVESRVFGVLIVARLAADSFSSGECEFLRQLSEHVALASHQVQLNSALQQAYDDLRLTQEAVMQQERLRALGQMASGIAHDINNALSPVALYTESLLKTEPSLTETGRGKLEIVQRAIDDAASTIARMNDFYRKRDSALVLAPVQTNVVVQQVLDLTQARWRDMPQQRGVVVEMRTELADKLPLVLGVESEFREALTNLVFNAIDALPSGGIVTMRTKFVSRGVGRGSVHIEVADTGVGMDETTRKRCLEPFFTTKGQRGTGLGLAMVYGMAQRHGADIEIDSAPGKGTVVRLVLAAAPSATATAPGTDAAMPRAGLNLLVVDDDPILLRSLRDVLEADGHTITALSGGEAGLAAFVATQAHGVAFDAVITDLGMPSVDGRRVAAGVKQLSPATPVIMLTGWGERLKAEEDMPEHVNYVLSKPPKLGELRVALAHCCNQKPHLKTA